MDEDSVFVVFNIFNVAFNIVNWPNCLVGTALNNTLDACWKLLLTKLHCTKKSSADSNFGTFSPSLSWSTSFFVLPYNFIVSKDNSYNV